MGSVFCTHDQDFLRLAAEGREHAGIVFAAQQRASVAGWVKALRRLHAVETATSCTNRVFFVPLR